MGGCRCFGVGCGFGVGCLKAGDLEGGATFFAAENGDLDGVGVVLVIGVPKRRGVVGGGASIARMEWRASACSI